MAYYDLHVHTIEGIGEDLFKDMAGMGLRLNLAGMGIAKYYSSDVELKWPAHDKLDIVKCLILKPESGPELVRMAKKVRESTEVLMVHGGDFEVNRKACLSPLIDVLCHPGLNRKDCGIDHVCAKEAHDNNVCIELNFREILQSYRKKRVHVLRSGLKMIRLCKKYGTKIITTSSAWNKWELRPGRQLASLSHLLGLDLSDAVSTVSTIPRNLVENNRKKLNNKKWKGVEVEA